MRLACLLFGPVLFAAEVTRIWDAAPHNAFTDLTYFKGRFICAFREARRHVSTDGKLRVLASKDGKKWQSLALLEDPKADLRDPKLTVTPKGELMLTSAAAYRERDNQSPVPHDSIAYFSKDGVQWSAPVKIGDPNFWLWRANWHKDKAYMIGYETMSRNGVTRLYQSNDGRTFQTVVPALHTENYTNESSIQFLTDGTAFCLLRRDGGTKTALWGTAKPPYTQWHWTDLGVRIGGPQFLRIPDGRWIGVVRLHSPTEHTAIVEISGTIKELEALPSKGDSSYAGMVWRKGELWISYYSSHEGKASIYLARWKPKA